MKDNVSNSSCLFYSSSKSTFKVLENGYFFFIDSLFRRAEFVFREIKGEISDKSDEYGTSHFTWLVA